MVKLVSLLFLLVIGVSTSLAYTCIDDPNSPRDNFQEHGCNCGTNKTSRVYPHLFSTYNDAFEGCHEGADDTSIECAFIEGLAQDIKSRLNRTSLSRIPVIRNGAQIYNRITCL